MAGHAVLAGGVFKVPQLVGAGAILAAAGTAADIAGVGVTAAATGGSMADAYAAIGAYTRDQILTSDYLARFVPGVGKAYDLSTTVLNAGETSPQLASCQR